MKSEKIFEVKFWETEDCRDLGICEIYEEYNEIDLAIIECNSLYKEFGFASIEVEDENGEVYYHISYDNQKKIKIVKYNNGNPIKYNKEIMK